MEKPKANAETTATNTNATYRTMQDIVDAYPDVKQVFGYLIENTDGDIVRCYTLSENNIPADVDEYSKITFNRVQKYEQAFVMQAKYYYFLIVDGRIVEQNYGKFDDDNLIKYYNHN